jgi:anti-sigma factor RsiW
MTSLHLAESTLQEAAESASLLPAMQAVHLHSCRVCQSRVATYQQLFTAVAQLPPPAFEFDLTARVLAQLPRPRPAFPWVLSGVAALVLGVVVAFMVLFGGVLAPVLQSLSTELGAGLMVVAGFLVAGQCLELLTRHRQQMRLLNFS